MTWSTSREVLAPFDPATSRSRPPLPGALASFGKPNMKVWATEYVDGPPPATLMSGNGPSQAPGLV